MAPEGREIDGGNKMITTKFKNYWSKRRQAQRRQGSVLLITIGGMIVVMGFCALTVDYGFLVSDANQLQRSCDAAALGGASKLPDQGDATSLATTVSTQNKVGPSVNGSGSVVDSLNITFLDDNKKIQVEATRSRTYLFAPIFNLLGGGINYKNGTVTRRAIASGPGGINPKTMPIGISLSTYEFYTMPTVNTAPVDLSFLRTTDTPYSHIGPPADGMVVYDMRDANSKSPAAMVDQIINGATPVIGQTYTVLNSSTNGSDGKFIDAINELFTRSSGSPWFDSRTVGVKYDAIVARTSPATNPRVVSLVINPDDLAPTGGGTNNYVVLKSVPVYLQSYRYVTQPDGSQSLVLTVRFLAATLGNSAVLAGGIKLIQ